MSTEVKEICTSGHKEKPLEGHCASYSSNLKKSIQVLQETGQCRTCAEAVRKSAWIKNRALWLAHNAENNCHLKKQDRPLCKVAQSILIKDRLLCLLKVIHNVQVDAPALQLGFQGAVASNNMMEDLLVAYRQENGPSWRHTWRTNRVSGNQRRQR